MTFHQISSSSSSSSLTDRSEIKCYGRYMIPPLLIFGVLAIGASLIIVGIHRGWFCESSTSPIIVTEADVLELKTRRAAMPSFYEPALNHVIL